LSFALLLIRPSITDDIFRFVADQAAARGAVTAPSIVSSQRAAAPTHVTREVIENIAGLRGRTKILVTNLMI
jgi:hypothetical protein